MLERDTQTDQRDSWAVGNIALLWTVSLAVFSFVRVFRVAHNSPTTALALFSATGEIRSVLGVVLSELQRLVELGLLLSVALFMKAEYPKPGRHEAEVNVLAVVVIAFWIAVVAVGSFWLALVSILVGIPYFARVISRPWRTPVDPGQGPISVALDRAARHLPEPPEDAPDRLKEAVATWRQRAEGRREELRVESATFARLSPEAKEALSRRSLEEARELLPSDLELTEDQLLDLAERVPPQGPMLRNNAQIRNAIIVVALFFAFRLAMSDTPWLSAEAITIGNAAPRTGFVLGESDSSLTVLWAEPRVVANVRADTLRSRSMCDNQELVRFVTLPEKFGWQAAVPVYPLCP